MKINLKKRRSLSNEMKIKKKKTEQNRYFWNIINCDFKSRQTKKKDKLVKYKSPKIYNYVNKE
jgi:hypothetical protein